MAKLCPVYATVLFLLSILGTLIAVVVSDKCKENIGVCSDECNSRCSSLHQGGHGLCKPPNIVDGQESCYCFYDCNPKTCEVGMASIGVCDERQCDSDCAAKFPGQGAQGFCYSIGPPIYDNCHCKYFC